MTNAPGNPTPQDMGRQLLKILDQPCLTPQEHLAAYRLITGGADLETRMDNDADTALIIAVWMGHAELVNSMILHGCDIDARGQNGETALIRAVFDKNAGMVNVLLAAGADAELRDDSGRSALDFSRQNRTVEIGRVLQPIIEAKEAERKKHRDAFNHCVENGMPAATPIPISRSTKKRTPPGKKP